MVGGCNSLRTKDPHEKVNNFHHQNFIHNIIIHCHYSLLHFHTIKQKLLHIFLANLKQETWSKEQRGMTGGFQRVTSDCSRRGSLKICLDFTDTAERRRLQLLGWCCGIWRINFLTQQFLLQRLFFLHVNSSSSQETLQTWVMVLEFPSNCTDECILLNLLLTIVRYSAIWSRHKYKIETYFMGIKTGRAE